MGEKMIDSGYVFANELSPDLDYRFIIDSGYDRHK
jgi:hypothetical protein